MNELYTIKPYKLEGQWVFDDPSVDLKKEPFVAGADTMINRATVDIPDADKGFNLIFSRLEFPGHQFKLDWCHEEAGGNWYYSPKLMMEGWLCPALFRYFEDAPKAIYVQVKPLHGG